VPGTPQVAPRVELRDRLLVGTKDAIFRFGWDRTSVSKICGAVGLTSGAFYPRFATRVDAAIALWSEWLGPMVINEASNLLDRLDQKDRQGFVTAMQHFADGSKDLDVVIELILAAQFDERLALIVGQDLREALLDRLHREDAPAAASRVLALVVAFGLTMSRHRSWAKNLDLTQEFNRYFIGLTEPGPVTEVPLVRADYLLNPRTVSHDPLVSAFYENGYLALSEVGYAKANLKDLCKSAGLTTGYLFARHAGKLDYFLEVIRQGWKANFEKGVAFSNEVERTYGPLIAEAVVIREFAQPDYRGQVRCNLEIQRLARFNAEAALLVDTQEVQLLEQVTASLDVPNTAAFATAMAVGNGMFFLTTFLSGLETVDYVAPLSTLLRLQGNTTEGDGPVI
jgi:hypothetical protein